MVLPQPAGTTSGEAVDYAAIDIAAPVEIAVAVPLLQIAICTAPVPSPSLNRVFLWPKPPDPGEELHGLELSLVVLHAEGGYAPTSRITMRRLAGLPDHQSRFPSSMSPCQGDPTRHRVSTLGRPLAEGVAITLQKIGYMGDPFSSQVDRSTTFQRAQLQSPAIGAIGGPHDFQIVLSLFWEIRSKVNAIPW